MFNKYFLLILSAALLSCGGCSSFSPYKMEIRQGNYVTPEMRKKVRIGMSRQQVSSVLGSPLVSDVFHANRWDYIYSFAEQGKQVEQRRYTLYFEGDFLKQIDDSQAEAGASALPAGK